MEKQKLTKEQLDELDHRLEQAQAALREYRAGDREQHPEDLLRDTLAGLNQVLARIT